MVTEPKEEHQYMAHMKGEKSKTCLLLKKAERQQPQVKIRNIHVWSLSLSHPR